jgi:hypothetical protein
VNELYSEKAKIPGRFLAQHAAGNRRRFVRHQTRRGSRGRGNSQLDNLFSLKNMRGSNTGACRADIESFGELDEINPQSIGAPQEHRNLNADAGVLPLVGRGHRFLSLHDLTWHFALCSTVELVRYQHTKCHSDRSRMHSKLFRLCKLMDKNGSQSGSKGKSNSTMSREFPQLCKWNGFTIDSPITGVGVWRQSTGKFLPLGREQGN